MDKYERKYFSAVLRFKEVVVGMVDPVAPILVETAFFEEEETEQVFANERTEAGEGRGGDTSSVGLMISGGGSEANRTLPCPYFSAARCNTFKACGNRLVHGVRSVVFNRSARDSAVEVGGY